MAGLNACHQSIGALAAQELVEQAARLLGRLAYHDDSKNALRDSGAITALLKILRLSKTPRGLQEVVAQALTILAVNNEVNQDYIRWGGRGDISL